ncbi:hypothetical protein V6N13_111692 [Hibiscus sabdariffa]
MREFMNVPDVRNLMNDPGMIRNLITSNPQFAELVDRNPELAHILNDPLALHRTLEAAKNPEIMRVMMKNTDRAMGNIESSPEGFNMLRHVYETVQAPFLNATTLAGATGNGGADPFAALLGTQGGNQVRDGSTNQSSPASGIPPDSPAPNTNPLQTRGLLRVLGFGPQLQSLVGSNSQLRKVMQNSQFLRQLTSPETMQQSLLSRLSRSQSTHTSRGTISIRHPREHSGIALVASSGNVDAAVERTLTGNQ